MSDPMETTRLRADRDAQVPDGSDVRVLLSVGGGGLAHFELRPGQVSHAVRTELERQTPAPTSTTFSWSPNLRHISPQPDRSGHRTPTVEAGPA
jgi:hypothetical protein